MLSNCAAAIALKSMVEEKLSIIVVFAPKIDNLSATTLSVPCLMSYKLQMKSRCQA